MAKKTIHSSFVLLGKIASVIYSLSWGSLVFVSSIADAGLTITLLTSLCAFILNLKMTYQDAPRFIKLIFGGQRWFENMITSSGDEGELPKGTKLSHRRIAVVCFATLCTLAYGLTFIALILAPLLPLMTKAMGAVGADIIGAAVMLSTLISLCGMQLHAINKLSMIANLTQRLKDFCYDLIPDNSHATVTRLLAPILTITMLLSGVGLSSLGLFLATKACYLSLVTIFPWLAGNATLQIVAFVMPLLSQIPFTLRMTVHTINAAGNGNIGLSLIQAIQSAAQTTAEELYAIAKSAALVKPFYVVYSTLKLSTLLLVRLAAGANGVVVFKNYMETSQHQSHPLSKAGALLFAIFTAPILIALQVIARAFFYAPFLIATLARGVNAFGTGEVVKAQMTTALMRQIGFISSAWLTFCFGQNGELNPTLQNSPKIILTLLGHTEITAAKSISEQQPGAVNPILSPAAQNERSFQFGDKPESVSSSPGGDRMTPHTLR